MQTGELIKRCHTTRDTVRFYIEEGLLAPCKVNGRYKWTELDADTLEVILEFRKLGLSVEQIKVVKALRDNHCGTREQWESNHRLISHLIQTTQEECEILQKRILVLEQVKALIQQRLDETS